MFKLHWINLVLGVFETLVYNKTLKQFREYAKMFVNFWKSKWGLRWVKTEITKNIENLFFLRKIVLRAKLNKHDNAWRTHTGTNSWKKSKIAHQTCKWGTFAFFFCSQEKFPLLEFQCFSFLVLKYKHKNEKFLFYYVQLDSSFVEPSYYIFITNIIFLIKISRFI